MASVPCRCGHSCRNGPRRGVRHLRQQARRRPAPPRRRGPEITSSTTSMVSRRCGEQVTYATTPPGPAAVSALRSSSICSPCNCSTASAGRRHRASGRRRSAPESGARHVGQHPAEGARTPGRPGGVGHDDVGPARVGAHRRRHQPGPVRSHVGGQHPRAGRSRRDRSAAPSCRPGRRRGPATSRPAPVARVSPQATSCDPSSWTPTRPSRTEARSAGLPDQRAANGEYGARLGARRPPARTRSARPGRIGQGDRGRHVVGEQRRLEFGRPGARRRRRRRSSAGGRWRWPARSRLVSPGGQLGDPLVPRPGGHPAEHRVHQPGDPLPHRGRARSTVAATAAWTGVAMARERVRAQPEQVEHGRLQRGEADGRRAAAMIRS